MWLFCAIATTLLWGVAELFYKKGSHEDEKYGHLKVCVIVGAVMGIHAIFTLLTTDVGYSLKYIWEYLPVSLCYIVSMACSYFGIRFIEESIADPIENSAGIMVTIFCVLFLGETLSVPVWIAIGLITIGILGVTYLENSQEVNRKGKLGKKLAIVAFIMPFLYAIIDAIGTFVDDIYLDIDRTPLTNVTEDNIELIANVSYELTFLFVAVVLFAFMKFKKVKFELPKQKDKILAAVCETAGQLTYVYAISGGNAVVSAPILSSVCAVALVLSRIFLKEKLTKKQYLFITLIIIGILTIGVMEGIEEGAGSVVTPTDVTA